MTEVNKNQIILDMCMTHRHDFALDAKESVFPSSGMTDQQREALRRDMEQLYEHHFEGIIAAQSARIAELEAACKRAEQVINRECQAVAAHHMRATALSFELEACRKDAERWRYMRDSCQLLDSDVFSAINEWLWGSGDIAEVAAAIDAAMQEARPDASS